MGAVKKRAARKPASAGVKEGMRAEYDFGAAKANPYVKPPRKQAITIRIDEPTLTYFKTLAEEIGMPYQSLVNFYLRDCAQNGRRPGWS